MAGRRRYSLSRSDRIQLIGAGKASAVMARAVARLLGRRVSGGLINVKYGHTVPPGRVLLNECGHPVPDERGVEGARRISEIARAAGAKVIVTDNRRHFLSALRYGLRVDTPAEFLTTLKGKRG